MSKRIDCFLIGHNEMKFSEYEKMVRSMGETSGAYRDLNYSFLTYKNHLYTLPDLINSYSVFDSSDLCMGDTFSAGIAYLGTFLHRAGLTFDYVNSFQEEKDYIREILETCEVGVVGITTTLYVSVFPILEIMSFIKEIKPDVKVAVGGPFVSTNIRTQADTTVQYVFRQIGADFYINSSQGEKALADLTEALRDNKPTDCINNIYYKKGDEYVVYSSERENNILENNMVDWSLYKDRVGEYVALRTAISCPFSCSFCGFPQHAGKYQTTSLKAIEYELDKLNEIGKTHCVHFIDDTFNVPPERFKDLMRMMIDKKYDFKWHSYFRCQFADEEMVSLMKESGCEGVFLGIESGSQEILNNMNKRVTVEEFYRGHKLLNDYEILTFDSFITGFPGETKETVDATIKFIEEMKPTFYRSQMWYCEAITPIYQEREKYGIVGSNFEWTHNTMSATEAMDEIDRIICTIKNSIWLPQYNFDMDSVYHLIHRDMPMDQIKNIVNTFADGIREKVADKSRTEVSEEVINRFKAACMQEEVKAEEDSLFGGDFAF